GPPGGAGRSGCAGAAGGTRAWGLLVGGDAYDGGETSRSGRESAPLPAPARGRAADDGGPRDRVRFGSVRRADGEKPATARYQKGPGRPCQRKKQAVAGIGCVRRFRWRLG